MDWTLAIARNRDALLRIVAMLFALAGLKESEAPPPASMPRHLRNYLVRILRPAESAARRLILIVARDMRAEAHPARSVILGLEPGARQQAERSLRAGQTTRTHSVKPETDTKAKNFTLPLLDPLKSFSLTPPRRRPKSFPRLTFLGLSDPVPIPDNWIPSRDDAIDATGLRRRLHALKRALDDLDGHAKRFARWRARRDLGRTRRFHPLRPGRPPGHRKRAFHDVDDVLRECHALALDAQREDTS